MSRGGLLTIAAAGFAIRLAALIGPQAAIASPTGYDDGVYFSASGLLLRGVVPYRDFVFVHPPAVLYFFSITSWLDHPVQAFAAARVLACIAGAINIVLVGAIVTRAAGAFPGAIAATLYAIYPDAIIAERSTYLEPVLNLAALGSAFVWLGGRRPFTAGLLSGAACAVKLWGGIWVLSSLISPSGAGEAAGARRALPRFLGGAVVAGVLLVGPFLLLAPDELVSQMLLFQIGRPADGVLDPLTRLRDIFDSGHRAASVLAIIGLMAIVRREVRYFATAVVLTVGGFLASTSYWSHYNSHLAASQCVLAGFGVATLLRIPRVSRVAAAAAVVVLIAVLDARALRQTLRNTRGKSPEMLTVAQTVPRLVPARAPLFAFDPTWSLAAGKWPPHADGAPVVVDSYGAMLLSAVRSGVRVSEAGAAFQKAPSHPDVRARLAATPFVVLGWRGNWQLNEPDRAWFASRFECLNPDMGDLCVWRRRAQPLAGASPTLADHFIHFGDGWYGLEGEPPNTWRWMGKRAVVRLPQASGARLELTFQVPLDSLGGAPNVTVELDGRLVERFVASAAVVSRLYAIDGRELVISTDRTFVPARSGRSSDERQLGLSLTAVGWQRR